MATTTIQQMISLDTPVANTGNSTFRRFLRWCEGQERNRFGWLGLALAVHGCALTPITLFAIILSGNFIGFWVVALIAMGMALVTNLAAMPTKITIPTFLASIVLDLGVILTCLFLMFR